MSTTNKPRTRAIDGNIGPDGRVQDLRIIYGPTGNILSDRRPPPKPKPRIIIKKRLANK